MDSYKVLAVCTVRRGTFNLLRPASQVRPLNRARVKFVTTPPRHSLEVALDDEDGFIVNAVFLTTLAQFVVPF